MLSLLSIELLYQLPIYVLLFGIALLICVYFCPKAYKYQRFITFLTLFITLAFVFYLILNTFYLKSLDLVGLNAISLSHFNHEQLYTSANEVSYNAFFSKIHQSMPISIENGQEFANISRNYFHRLYAIDSYGLMYTFMILVVSITVILLLYRSLKLPTRNQIAIDIALLFAIIGSILMIFSSHLLIFYFSLEIVSLSLIFLLSLNVSISLSIDKMIHTWTVSLVGSALFLLGVGLSYANNHELTFSAISLNLATNDQSAPLSMIGLSFMFLSILFKLGLAPIQSRFINQIQSLSYPISLFLLAVINIAIFCCLSRLFLISTIVNNETIKIIVIVIASCSIIFGNIGALYQKTLNAMIAYLYISFFGYLLIPFIAMQYQIYVLETIHLCLIGYILAFIVIYSVLTIESTRKQKNLKLEDLTGLVKQQRLNSILFTIALFSIANIPLTIGFIGYFFLILTAVTAHLWFFIALFILSTITGLYLCLKLIVTLFKKPIQAEAKQILESQKSSFLARYKINELIALIAVFAILFFGFFPKWLVNLATLSVL